MKMSGPALLCAVVGLLAFTAAPALGAPPEAPETLAPEAGPGASTILRGVIDPKVAVFPVAPGTYQFLYNVGGGCEGGGAAPESPGMYFGLESELVSQSVTGLAPGSEYTVCLRAINSKGEASALTEAHFRTPEAPETLAAGSVTPATAKLNGVLNPGGKGEAGSYQFLYAAGESCQGGQATFEVPSTGARETVPSVEVSGLTPGVEYTFCLLVRNEQGGVALGEPKSFTTGAVAPIIEKYEGRDDEYATEVSATSATLGVEINPGGADTTYYVQYGSSEAYGSETAPVSAGAQSTPLAVQVKVTGLNAGATYHFHFVISSNVKQGVKGEPVSFTTQPATTAFALPDNRAWELVSPPNKRGGFLQALSAEGPIQAAEDGSAFTYGDLVPPESEPQGNGGLGGGFSQLRSVRGAQGWSTRDIASPHDGPPLSNFELSEYLVFSPDLSTALLDPLGEDNTLLSAQASEPTPYIRRESLCDTPATAAECYLPVLTGKQPYADVPPGTEFGKHGGTFVWFEGGVFEGASSDLSHVVLRSNVQLTTTPTPLEGQEIYEWVAGAPPAQALQLVSVLPAGEGGKPAKLGSVGVGANEEQAVSGARYAVSSAGSRVFWSAAPKEGGVALYMRDTAKGETLRLDVQQPGAPSGEPAGAIFQAASADGSRVYFTDSQRLTEHSGSAQEPKLEDGDLYECRIVEEAGHLKCELTDLTPESGGRSAEVQNILSGVSEDGSYVYFVANGVLGDAAAHGATQGECARHGNTASSATCNLYEYHAGVITFIRALGAEDEHDWGSNEVLFHDISLLTAQASRNGRFLAFMSSRSLTGYDNRDAVSGKPDQEVYLYDAGSGRLVCASCNPTGARPAGIEVGEFNQGKHKADIAAVLSTVGGQNFTKESWVAANLPYSWVGQARRASVYQQRYLTNDGRLFFNASDALVPGDVNGNEDVYEFEPSGIRSPEGKELCTAAGTTYSPRSAGCVSLISSGTASEESGFLDASAVGPGGEEAEDVFFLTAGRLSPLDTDTAYDVYDAHTCSGAAPCFVAGEAPPACSGEASCRPAPSPQPQTFGPPPSATFSGPGNLTPTPPPRGKPKTAAQLRAEKLAVALKLCRKKHNRHKRLACEKQAHKRYPSKSSKGGK
jgi:hypothetical protein